MSTSTEPGAQRTLAQSFSIRSNSIGFLRWLLAFLVIFSHAGPLGGFYGGHDLGTQISSEQSLGGVAVAGFFFFSGYLITNSRRSTRSTVRFFWRRCLRILPAFWAALIFTAFIAAPLAWRAEKGTFDGYLSVPSESPLTYVWNNMGLVLNQRNIGSLGSGIPYAALGGHDWNGSAWTLEYEFKAYILVGVLGIFGVLGYRLLASSIAVGIIVVNALTWAGIGNPAGFSPLFGNPYNQMLIAPFAFGILAALWADRVVIDDRLAAGAAIVAAITYDIGGWNVFGQYAFCYVLMWFAIRATKLNRWERFGDFSYGIYIFAWPLMQLGAFYGLEKRGWLVYHVTIILAVHLLAFLSWHLIEKPAMSLKNWSPGWLARVQTLALQWRVGLQRRLVRSRYSSTRKAGSGAA